MELKTKDMYGSLPIPWEEGRLNEKEMKFLWDAIENADTSHYMMKELAGNIHKSLKIYDKDNWFFSSVLLPLVAKDFYGKWENYYKYRIAKEESLPEFQLTKLWVNFQKAGEFNPFHNHTGLYSFVIFMKIPTDWKQQHSLPIASNSNSPSTSDFQFIFVKEGVYPKPSHNIRLGSKDEGRMLFFPAKQHHQVYPFYGTDEERITISGNIAIKEDEEGEINLISGRKESTTDPEQMKKMVKDYMNNWLDSVSKTELYLNKDE